MSLLTCHDCHQPVSSEAFECPTCGRPVRDRSYLTPGGQTVVGALALIACFAWPPLIAVLLLIVFCRYLARVRRGSTLRLAAAAGAVIVLCVVAMYALPSLAFVALVLASAALIWLASARFGAQKPRTQDMLSR